MQSLSSSLLFDLINSKTNDHVVTGLPKVLLNHTKSYNFSSIISYLTFPPGWRVVLKRLLAFLISFSHFIQFLIDFVETPIHLEPLDFLLFLYWLWLVIFLLLVIFYFFCISNSAFFMLSLWASISTSSSISIFFK